MAVEDSRSPGLAEDHAVSLGGELTRRRLLTLGAQGAVTLGAGSLLAGCGSGSSRRTHTSLAGGKPLRGGTLTIGMITGGTAETLNPGLAVTYTDILRCYQLYDFLFQPGEDIKTLTPVLATSAEPNRDATVWTIQLRQGVTWHDGKPFTADDVLWTLRTWSKPTNFASGFVGQFIDFPGLRKRGPLTVEVPLIRPTAQFPSLFTVFDCGIIQDGAPEKSFGTHPVGTGPFKFVSFTPGSQTVFAANTDYWREPGKPYIDKLVINSTFTDETSRNNALLSGQVDLSPLYPFDFAKQQQSAGQVNILTSPGTGCYYCTMRVDRGPFADVRVRQAMKLLVDRQQLIQNVFAGFGRQGADDFVIYTDYGLDPIPTYDVEKAKALLKAAGREGLSVTLQTANAQAGYVEAATLLAEEAQQAGVHISVQQLSPATYFTPATGYLSGRLFGQDTSACSQSLTVYAAAELLKGCAYNETNWSTQAGGGDQALLNQAIAELDPGKAAELWAEVQQQQISEGGLLVWGWPDWIDAAATRVRGLSSGKPGPLNNYRVLDAWLAS